jgi:hypothetical protein
MKATAREPIDRPDTYERLPTAPSSVAKSTRSIQMGHRQPVSPRAANDGSIRKAALEATYQAVAAIKPPHQHRRNSTATRLVKHRHRVPAPLVGRELLPALSKASCGVRR